MYKMSKHLSLINFSNSILKRYGINTFHDSIKEVDELLKNKKKIVLILCDGMGKYLLNIHKDVAKDLLDHYFITISSTFPPTTVAATTALLSGKYPLETGYMAWSQPFNNFSINLDMFTKRDSQSKLIADPNLYENEYPLYENIVSLINKKNKKNIAKGIFEYPVDQKGPKNFDGTLNKILEYAYQEEETFTYVYLQNPDHDSHDYGVNSIQVKNDIKLINDKIKKFADENKDLTIIVFADHGQINIDSIILEKYPDILKFIKYHPSFEPRSSNIKLKDNVNHHEFEQLFNSYFGDDFLLLTKEEVLKEELFGYDIKNSCYSRFIGDYMAIAKTNKAIFLNKEEAHFVGHHGGPTKEEMEIDLLVFNK